MFRISRKPVALLVVCAVLFSGTALVWTPVANADLVAQNVPFSQNWANTGLITLDDTWDSVPGIIGYRGDDLTTSTGVDPQMLLADGSSTPIDVNANRSDPNSFTTGGLAEFDGIPNPVVGLNGSGTGDAPHMVISLNTTAATGITVAYNVRDLDGSGDNAIQPVALHYRVGNVGSYTNIPAAFVADATTAGSATQVTPVSITLPPAAENQPLVQLRIMTTNAVGNDEWVGIDDINIGTGGTTVLSGTGLATPSQVFAGQNSLLTVAVTPASTPPSTGIAVTANLSAINLSPSQQFFDNGTNGDTTAGDNVFSYLAAVPVNSPIGPQSLPATITDAQARNANANIALTVNVPHDAAEHIVMGNPSNAVTDPAFFSNYLLSKTQYVMSYHRDRGIPNWVSWHLDSTWLGTAPRQDDFRNDPSLPAGWYQVQSTDYAGSGFDRGHHTPSADRTSSIP